MPAAHPPLTRPPGGQALRRKQEKGKRLVTGARMLESVVAAVAGPDGVEAYVAAMLQDRYKRAGIPKGEGNLMWQSVQFGAHSSPTELTGLGYDTIGLTTQTVDFGATYSWHAVIWPALISVFEEVQNAGGVKIYDIAKTRLDNVMGEAMRREPRRGEPEEGWEPRPMAQRLAWRRCRSRTAMVHRARALRRAVPHSRRR